MRLIRFDRKGNQLGDLNDILEATWTRGTDGTRLLEATLLGGQQVDKGDRIVFIDGMGRAQETIVVSPEHRRAGEIVMTGLVCRGSLQELENKFIEDIETVDATARATLSRVLDGTRWLIGDVESTGTASLQLYHMSALEALREICDAYHLEATTDISLNTPGTRIRQRTVNLTAAQGRSDGILRRFDYGYDLTGIRRTIDASGVKTRIYGYGKGLQSSEDGEEADYTQKVTFEDIYNAPYVEDRKATEQWGVPGPDGTMQPAEGVYENGECDDPEQLLEETKAELERLKQPIVTYEATVLQYQQAGTDMGGVDLGDRVQIADDTFTPPLRLEGRVLELEENLLDPTDIRVTIGNVTETLTRRQQATQQTLDRIQSNIGAWDDAAGLRNRYMDGVIGRLNQVMNKTGGYTYIDPGKGILVYDRPEDDNPTMCIQIGGGYFRIADGRKSDGSWNFRTLGDGHGLYADTLYTGRISDGTSYWDLNNGELQMSGEFRALSPDGENLLRINGSVPGTVNGTPTVGPGIMFENTGIDGIRPPSIRGWLYRSGNGEAEPGLSLHSGNDDSPTSKTGAFVYATKAIGGSDYQAAISTQDDSGITSLVGASNDGNVFFGGYLGFLTEMGTFQTQHWLYLQGGSGSGEYAAARVAFAPPRKGTYSAIACSESTAKDCMVHVSNVSSSGCEVCGYGQYGADIYVTVLAYLRR